MIEPEAAPESESESENRFPDTLQELLDESGVVYVETAKEAADVAEHIAATDSVYDVTIRPATSDSRRDIRCYKVGYSLVTYDSDIGWFGGDIDTTNVLDLRTNASPNDRHLLHDSPDSQ